MWFCVRSILYLYVYLSLSRLTKLCRNWRITQGIEQKSRKNNKTNKTTKHTSTKIMVRGLLTRVYVFCQSFITMHGRGSDVAVSAVGMASYFAYCTNMDLMLRLPYSMAQNWPWIASLLAFSAMVWSSYCVWFALGRLTFSVDPNFLLPSTW